jgi:hypothetical protein
VRTAPTTLTASDLLPLPGADLQRVPPPPAADATGAAKDNRSPQRSPWPFAGLGATAAFGSGAGSGLLLFGLLGFLFLLAIPNAVRWLRPVSALGMSPAYVALSDRPG